MNAPGGKQELFESIRQFWPEVLLIAPKQTALPAVLTEPCTVETYDAIDASLPQGNEWLSLAAWAFHQALSQLVRRELKAASTHVRTGCVSFEAFDAMMEHNLSDEIWDEERPIWAGLPRI